jgi:hypothetical protein
MVVHHRGTETRRKTKKGFTHGSQSPRLPRVGYGGCGEHRENHLTRTEVGHVHHRGTETRRKTKKGFTNGSQSPRLPRVGYGGCGEHRENRLTSKEWTPFCRLRALRRLCVLPGEDAAISSRLSVLLEFFSVSPCLCGELPDLGLTEWTHFYRLRVLRRLCVLPGEDAAISSRLSALLKVFSVPLCLCGEPSALGSVALGL